MDAVKRFLESDEFLSLPDKAKALVLIYIGYTLSDIVLRFWFDHKEELKKLGFRLY